MRRKTIVALSLALCLLFTCFGLVGCGDGDGGKVVEEDAPGLITLEDWDSDIKFTVAANYFTYESAMDTPYVLPAIFDCYDAESGLLLNDVHPTKQLLLDEGEIGHWTGDRYDGSTPQKTFIEIKAKTQGETYLGYAVIEVRNVGDHAYRATLLKSAQFPPKDKKGGVPLFQSVTEEQVDALIENAKKLSK